MRHSATSACKVRLLDTDATSTLIGQIYSAAAGRRSWEPALDAISTHCDCWAVQLLAVDKRDGVVLFSHYGGRASAEAHLEYLRTYQYLDPRAPLVFAPREQDWFHCHEAISEEQVAASPFYQEFLIPVGARYVSAVSLVDDNDLGVMLAVLRGVGKQPLEPETLAWLDGLRPHLVEAMAIYRHLSAVYTQTMAGQLILNRLVHPVLLVDASGSVRFANAAGQTALASRLAVCEVGGRLHACDPTDDLALAEALRTLVVAAPRMDHPERRFIRLRGTSWEQKLGISLSALRPAETRGAFGTLPLAMLVLHDANLIASCDAFVLQELYGLTPAEANVGVLLSEGENVESIAARRCVAISTVRSQLRSLMEKTGAQRQSDLVRRLVTLPHGLNGFW